MTTADQYNNNLPVEDQIDTEEQIAAVIYDTVISDYSAGEVITEETAGRLSRQVLKLVLKRFRPDVFGYINPVQGMRDV